MKIIRKIEFQMTDSGMEETFRDEYEYSGPIAHCGGGPDATQKAQESAQANESNQEATAAAAAEKFKETQQARVNPFYGNMMDNGTSDNTAALDYAGGTNAAAYAPAKAALMQSLGASTGLPSGYKDQAVTDFNENRAQAYDGSLAGINASQQAAKERGAAGLLGQAQLADPTALYGGATQGNQAVFSVPRSPGIAGTLGSLIGAGATLGSAAIRKGATGGAA